MFFLLGLLCLSYYILICLTLKRWNSTFSRVWLLGGVILVAGSYLPAGSMAAQILHWSVLLPAPVLLVTAGVIIMGTFPGQQQEYDYLIVLGAQVRGKRITDSLMRRLEKALDYLKQHPDTKVIVSGGQGKGEDITEAQAMADYLIAKGIKSERILLEDESRTTWENLKFSKRYLPDMSVTVGIVSNNFHVYRACCYAKRMEISNAYPVAAGCHPVLFVNYLVRECLAVWKMWLKGQR